MHDNRLGETAIIYSLSLSTSCNVVISCPVCLLILPNHRIHLCTLLRPLCISIGHNYNYIFGKQEKHNYCCVLHAHAIAMMCPHQSN